MSKSTYNSRSRSALAALAAMGYDVRTMDTFAIPYYYIQGATPFGLSQNFRSPQQLLGYVRQCAKSVARGEIIPQNQK